MTIDKMQKEPDAEQVIHENLKALGESSVNKKYYAKDGVDKDLLERFPNPMRSPDISLYTEGVITIKIPEFTSLCPITGQPDYAEYEIEYVPDEYCVESKSLKLYMGSFRNQGEFHESSVQRVLNDLVELTRPIMMIVRGIYTPRGGIAIHPSASYYKEDFGSALNNNLIARVT